MCKAAGISGYKTNHSLRATTATRLYQAGVEEQLERTGHRSLDGVRSYKRTSDEQRVALSDILNITVPDTKKPKVSCPNTLQSAACSQLSQQMGMAPTQISLQECSNITFNVTYNSRVRLWTQAFVHACMIIVSMTFLIPPVTEIAFCHGI